MYLGSQGTNTSSSPRLAHKEYSYKTALDWSFPLEISVDVALSRKLPPLSKMSTIKFSGNPDTPSSNDLDSTLICPLRRYFSPFK